MPRDPLTYLSIALYSLALFNCYRLIEDRRSPQTTMAWIFALIAFPWVSVPTFYLLGQNRIRVFLRRHREGMLFGQRSVGLVEEEIEGESHALESETLVTFRSVFSRFGQVFYPARNRVGLLVDGKATFEEIFRAIDQAEHYILVQYYILRSDRLGIELKELLVRKARSGIPTYLLYDDMGSFWLKRDYIRDLRKAGVAIARFLPITNIRRLQHNFRNHRKLVVVDGKSAFTGGLNVGDEYVGRQKHRYWRDTHVEVSGPAVRQLEEVFLDDWFFATGRSLALPRDKHLHQSLTEDALPADASLAQVQVIPSGPTDNELVAPMLFMLLINSAKRRLWIATPYFIPDLPLQRALELAVLRGVEVSLLMPERSDSKVVHWVSLSYAEELLAKGVRVHLYRRGFMHQKVLLVDNQVAAVGTTNFDNRAMYLNFEMMLVIHQESFCRDVERMLINDFAASRLMYPSKRRWFRRIRGDFGRIFAPLL